MIGKSGCGKTSLLNSLFGINFEGKVVYDKAQLFGQDLKDNSCEKYKFVSYCPQFCQDALNPKITLDHHIQLVLKSNDIRMRKTDILNIMEGLSLNRELLNFYPYMMSGGQKQRVAIMLCIIKNPRLLVLDEPTSALDLINTKIISDFLVNIKNKASVLIVSHNKNFLNKICDKIWNI